MTRGRPTPLRCALAALALAACAGARPPGEAAGRGAWRELSAPGFVLSTDVSPELARRVMAELERDRALLAAAMPALAAVDRRLEVVAFASGPDFREATGGRADYVAFAAHDAAGRQWILLQLSATGEVEEHAVEVAHELAHALTLHAFPRQPAWLSEGLAVHLSSVALVRGGRHFLGPVPADGLAAEDPLPLRQVLAWQTAGQGREQRLYASAWRLVRYLATEEPSGLAELGRRLAAGEPEDAAWDAAFPRFPRTGPGLARLTRALGPWGERLPGTWREVTAPADPAPAAERRLTAAEVHTLRLRVRPAWDRRALEREVDAALRADPGHVAALARLAAWSPADAEALARRAVAAHPEDPAAWSLLAGALPGDGTAPEAVAALRRAAALAPDDPAALGALARAVAGEAPGEGEALAARAVRLAPWSAELRALHALALAGAGRCAEGEREASRGVALTSAEDPGASAALRREVEALCAPDPPPGPR